MIHQFSTFFKQFGMDLNTTSSGIHCYTMGKRIFLWYCEEALCSSHLARPVIPYAPIHFLQEGSLSVILVFLNPRMSLLLSLNGTSRLECSTFGYSSRILSTTYFIFTITLYGPSHAFCNLGDIPNFLKSSKTK